MKINVLFSPQITANMFTCALRARRMSVRGLPTGVMQVTSGDRDSGTGHKPE